MKGNSIDELTQKIHRQLTHSTDNLAEWLELLKEAENFCATADDDELTKFHEECYGCEVFARIAKGLEYEDQNNDF